MPKYYQVQGWERWQAQALSGITGRWVTLGVFRSSEEALGFLKDVTKWETRIVLL